MLEIAMSSRRHFLKAGAAAAATGIVFCGCGLSKSAHAQQGSRAKLPVTVSGKRVKTIDVHAHCHFREAGALLGEEGFKLQVSAINGATETYIDLSQRLAAMDAQAVDMEILSINPFWYNRERDVAAQIVKLQNEKLAEFCAANSSRFAAFASLTLQAPDLAVQELETAARKQGLKGAAIGGSVNGIDFSDPKFYSVWAKAEELGVPLFIHPRGIPELNKRFAGNGWLDNTIGNPLDTTIALSHLIFEGTLDRFPGLKVIAAHGGGYLPSYADRSDHACMVGPKGCTADVKLKKRPSEYLKQIFRFAGLHPRGDPPSGRAGRRRPDRARQRLSLSLAAQSGGPHPCVRLAQRRGEGRYSRPHRREAVQSRGVRLRDACQIRI